MTPSAVGKLVERWRAMRDAMYGTEKWEPALGHALYMCADELEAALATAPPEQAGHQHTDSCFSRVPETEGKGEYLSCGKVAGDPPQAASDGALDADFAQIIKDLREAKATLNGKPVMEVTAANNWIADRIEAVLASHDQKVRADVCEEIFNLIPASKCIDDNSAQFREGFRSGLEAYRQAIRSLASGAEEK